MNIPKPINRPALGQTYRHRKHSPNTGHYHEYKVIGIVEPFPKDPSKNRSRTHFYYPKPYRHTDTGNLLALIGCGTKIYADDITEPHVAYKNTQPDLCDRDWVFCLRPLREFVDGRFRLVG